MICNKCGKEILNGNRFCGNCGNMVEEQQINQQPVYQQSMYQQPMMQPQMNGFYNNISTKKNIPIGLILAIVCALSLIIVVSVVLVLTLGDSDDNKSNEQKKSSSSSLVGNIEKSRESKDLQNLDTIYLYLTQIMTVDAIFNEINNSMANGSIMSIPLKTLFDGNLEYNNLEREMCEFLNEVPELSAECNKEGTITIVFVKSQVIKVGVCVEDKYGNIILCDKTEYSDGKKRLMSVGTVGFEE